uniref:POPLD domain-containing protein n=1 Tax=Ciona savignyi TaxID=51511 RepID=H2YH77_CIOSA
MSVAESSFALETTLSPLWDPSLRNEASGSRLPDHKVSTRKNQAKFSNPEESEKYLKELARPVPVILIRRSGFQNSASVLPQHLATADSSETKSVPPRSFGAGWDLIMPAKWATAFWISLIYHQARAGGLREQSRVHLEYKKPFFPRDYPECQSGANYWDAVMKEKKKVYYRKPPAKRANYHHLASPFPFAPCWQHIFDQDVKTKLSVTDLTQNTKILNECIKEQ